MRTNEQLHSTWQGFISLCEFLNTRKLNIIKGRRLLG